MASRHLRADAEVEQVEGEVVVVGEAGAEREMRTKESKLE